jgi:hypothetical protein
MEISPNLKTHYPMPGCLFIATGKQFDADAFLSQSEWRDITKTFHRGESTGRRSLALENSGFTLNVSDSDEHELEPQVCDALEFLNQEIDEIKRLTTFPGMEHMELRIGLFWCRDTLFQFHSLPAAFLRSAGELGIAVTLCIYGTSLDEAEESTVAKPSAATHAGPAAR